HSATKAPVPPPGPSPLTACAFTARDNKQAAQTQFRNQLRPMVTGSNTGYLLLRYYSPKECRFPSRRFYDIASHRKSDVPFDHSNNLTWPNRLHHCVVRSDPPARHLKQISAHNDGLRVLASSGVGDHQSVSVR